MHKRFLTTLLLLLFSVLPVAAQVYQVAEFIGETLAQSDEEGEIMACCLVAGQCRMTMPEPSSDPAATRCPMQCECYASAPALPSGLLTPLPQAPLSDEAPIAQAQIKTGVVTSTVLVLMPAPPFLQANKTYLRHTCIRI